MAAATSPMRTTRHRPAIRPTNLLLALVSAIALLTLLGNRSEEAKKAAASAASSSIQNRTSNAKQLPLHEAIKAQDSDRVHTLLQAGADVNREDSDGITPLIEAVLSGNDSLVRILLDSGALAQPSPGFRHTPLRAACLTGNAALIELLLEKGADPNSKSEGERSPLMGCCYLRPMYPDELSAPAVQAMLTDPRTDPTAANSFGETALDLCRERKYGQSVDILMVAVDAWNKA